ncbi:acyltransferase family protein [Baaleninema sp.]|uniref:acyltransferase family protein n=1 Tax=Baaleninema sp. TaxID=3101197 RepID=UPI003D070133
MLLSDRIQTSKPHSSRIAWLDIAKAYGIFLVFYGHLLESFVDLDYVLLLSALKFKHSFHIPLFFILSGYVYKDKKQSLGYFLKYQALSRLLPVLVFNTIGLGIALVFPAGQQEAWNLEAYVFHWLKLLRGFPVFSAVTWFLVCLFVVEIIHFGLKRYLRSARAIFGAAIAFSVVGALVNSQFDLVVSLTGIDRNVWYVYEAIAAYSFYLFGLGCARLRVFASDGGAHPHRGRSLAVAVGGVALTVLTFGLNSGPFRGSIEIVSMAVASYGNWFWFLLTALAGALATMAIAQLTPPWPPLLDIGRSTLILLGLNGILDNTFNIEIVRAIAPYFNLQNSATAHILAFGLTLLSLLVAWPVAKLLNTVVPQLMGRPKARGPWLKPLVR